MTDIRIVGHNYKIYTLSIGSTNGLLARRRRRYTKDASTARPTEKIVNVIPKDMATDWGLSASVPFEGPISSSQTPPKAQYPSLHTHSKPLHIASPSIPQSIPDEPQGMLKDFAHLDGGGVVTMLLLMHVFP
mmetsp:Transcript_117307/g.215909  ORF Transcript_117307/g.215909 Transcript_117307/m.215909 type:complete len:132 (+) Transcript_117307:60-455(+)